MATNSSEQIQRLKKLEQSLSQQLSGSKTAYTSNVQPSSSDLSTQLQLMKTKRERESLEQESLRERVYGPGGDEDTIPDEERSEGAISRGLAALSTPLYGVVGAVEAATGTGTKTGLANIPQNIKERGLFGDIVKKTGVPGYISAPLGFALDVALDPVNWATLGTAALVPRIATGIAKGGVAGGLLGAKSGILTKGEQLSRLVPGLARDVRTGSKTKLASAARTVSEKAQESRGEFRKLYGKSIEDELAARSERLAPFRAEALRQRIPEDTATRRFFDAFKDKKKDWFEGIKKGDREDAAGRIGGTGESKKQLEVLRIEDEHLTGVPKLTRALDEASGNGTRVLDEGMEVALYDGKRVRTSETTGMVDVETVSGRMASEFDVEEEYQAFVKSMWSDADKGWRETMKTEVKFYDDFMDSVRKNPTTDKIMNAYEAFIGTFKAAKVGGSLSSWVNAVVGNLTMAWMAGVKAYNPEYIAFVGTASSIMRGNRGPKARALVDEMVGTLGWSKFMEQYPGLVRKIYGFDPIIFLDENKAVRRALESSAEKFSPKEINEMAREVKKARERILTSIRSSRQTNAVDVARGLQPGEAAGSGYASEVFGEGYKNGFKQMMEYLENSNNRGLNRVASALVKPMRGYENIDQSYKFGNALYLSLRGIDEDELKLLSRVVNIKPSDYSEVGGLFKLSPERASEISQEIFMNYGAMPAAVKMLRSLPLLGSPFASFIYSMGVKSGKTLMYNPALYTKAQSFLGEMQGQKSPIEKAALREPYYQWYNKLGMQRLPFFQDNPVYMNVANMIPYYTMNMFEPSERTYNSRASGIAASIFDKIPFLKTPEGQIMYDYFIQPLILREAVPRGMFDQPLWTVGASGWEKTRNVIRSATESVVPGYMGFAGLITPEAVADYLPSYRWRQISRAKAGKTAEGIQTKEDPVRKTVRGLGSVVGIPLHPLNLQNLSSQVQKSIK